MWDFIPVANGGHVRGLGREKWASGDMTQGGLCRNLGVMGLTRTEVGGRGGWSGKAHCPNCLLTWLSPPSPLAPGSGWAGLGLGYGVDAQESGLWCEWVRPVRVW